MTDTKEKLMVIEKAESLMDNTMTITVDRKKYPVKYRVLVERMQNAGFDIYAKLKDANRRKLDDQKQREQRFMLQTDVISLCEQLNHFICYSQERGLISINVCRDWSKLCCDVRNMTLSWRASGMN